MPHQCTHCSRIFPDAAQELLSGCSCGSKFFYYIKQEKYEEIKSETRAVMAELEKADKVQIEKDIRELTGLDQEPDKPVILDLESIRVIRPGKFEIDIVNLFSKKRPIIYKLGEGKYIIDLESSFQKGALESASFIDNMMEDESDDEVDDTSKNENEIESENNAKEIFVEKNEEGKEK
ncbi:MAG: Zn-ribbon containing protein [Nanoarchaeota archaeon]